MVLTVCVGCELTAAAIISVGKDSKGSGNARNKPNWITRIKLTSAMKNIEQPSLQQQTLKSNKAFNHHPTLVLGIWDEMRLRFWGVKSLLNDDTRSKPPMFYPPLPHVSTSRNLGSECLRGLNVSVWGFIITFDCGSTNHCWHALQSFQTQSETPIRHINQIFDYLWLDPESISHEKIPFPTIQ